MPVRLLLCVLLSGLVLVACDRPESTPGWVTSKTVLDLCGWEQNELTGDLATDIPGAWRQSGVGFGSHPLTTLASNPQVLVFEPNGTGRIWWTGGDGVTDLTGGDMAFEWSVENNQLVVDDLPAAEVEAVGPGELVVQGIDDEASGNTPWARCQDKLLNSLPDGD